MFLYELHLDKNINYESDTADLYIKKAAENGLPEAQYYYGLLLKKQKNYKKAFEYFLLSYESGVLSAKIELGLCLLEKNCPYRDPEMGVSLLEDKRFENRPDILTKLAQYYEKGDIGFSKNMNKALEFYNKAAELGDIGAIKFLIKYYAENELYESAYYWYLKLRYLWNIAKNDYEPKISLDSHIKAKLLAKFNKEIRSRIKEQYPDKLIQSVIEKIEDKYEKLKGKIKALAFYAPKEENDKLYFEINDFGKSIFYEKELEEFDSFNEDLKTILTNYVKTTSMELKELWDDKVVSILDEHIQYSDLFDPEVEDKLEKTRKSIEQDFKKEAIIINSSQNIKRAIEYSESFIAIQSKILAIFLDKIDKLNKFKTFNGVSALSALKEIYEIVEEVKSGILWTWGNGCCYTTFLPYNFLDVMTYASDFLGYVKCDKNGKIIDEKAYIQWLTWKIKKGDKKSYIELAKHYCFNNATETGSHWFKKALKNGIDEARFYLTCFCNEKIENPPTKEEEFNFLKNLAKENNILAQTLLGERLFKGIGAKKDIDEGVSWLKKACKKKHPEACYLLAVLYDNEDIKGKDPELPIRYYIEAIKKGNKKYLKKIIDIAEKGNISAMLAVGDWFSRKSKHERAFNFYYKASIYGNSLALEKLENYAEKKTTAEELVQIGDIYYYGFGHKVNYEKAFYWYKKAASKGNAEAQYKISFMYKYGLAVKRSRAEARSWFKLANKQNHYLTKYDNKLNTIRKIILALLVIMSLSIYVTTRYLYYTSLLMLIIPFVILTFVFLYLKLVAKLGGSRHQYYLAKFYEIIIDDIDKAVELYKKSAQKGIKESQFCIGIKYYYGIGIEKDRRVAFSFISDSAKKEYNEAKKFLENIRGDKHRDLPEFTQDFYGKSNEKPKIKRDYKFIKDIVLILFIVTSISYLARAINIHIKNTKQQGIIVNNNAINNYNNGIKRNYSYNNKKGKKHKKLDNINFHKSLANFQKNILLWQAGNFIIRVDKLSNGKYRYAAWRKNMSFSEKPSLILKNGYIIEEYENKYYIFTNNNYSYIIKVSRRLSDSELIVMKNNRIILQNQVTRDLNRF